jgi:hypothetical protein
MSVDRYLDLFTEIATAAGVAYPDLVGRQWLMLLEGATVLADHHRLGRSAATDGCAAALVLPHAAPESVTQATGFSFCRLVRQQ